MKIPYQTTLAVQQTADTEDPLAIGEDEAHQELVERLCEVVVLMQEKYPDRAITAVLHEQVQATGETVL